MGRILGAQKGVKKVRKLNRYNVDSETTDPEFERVPVRSLLINGSARSVE